MRNQKSFKNVTDGQMFHLDNKKVIMLATIAIPMLQIGIIQIVWQCNSEGIVGDESSPVPTKVPTKVLTKVLTKSLSATSCTLAHRVGRNATLPN